MGKFDIYETITNRIIEELENGVIPWRKPWTGLRSGAISRSTGRAYSIMNQMLLGNPGEYITYTQLQEVGGRLKKGAKKRMVVFWKMMPIEEKDKNNKPVKKIVPFLRYYYVYHIDDCEGIEQKYPPEKFKLFDPIAEAETATYNYLRTSGCRLEHVANDRAYYAMKPDKITLPMKEQFDSAEEYYSTLFHEIVHSTGHEKRLNRDMSGGKGSPAYSKEELVAEIGAAAILHYFGIETSNTFKNNAAYIDSWLRALRNDKRLIVSAAGKADKAFNLIVQDEEQQQKSA